MRWDLRIFIAVVACIVTGVLLHGWTFVRPLALPYFVLFLAARLPFQKFERIGDYSYGIYIYSFSSTAAGL